MFLLDVAAGPIIIMAVIILVVAILVVAGLIFGAIKLIQKIRRDRYRQ